MSPRPTDDAPQRTRDSALEITTIYERRVHMRISGFAIVAALTLAAALPPTTAHAQGGQGTLGGGFGRMYGGLADSLRAQLEMTREQDSAVTGILKVSQERRQEIMNKYAGQRNREGFQAMRAQMQDIQAETEEQLDLVLTQDQMDQYRALRTRLGERFRSQRGGRRPPGSR